MEGSIRALDWNDVRFFLAVARARRLAKAAKVLGVDQTTVGRRLAALEERFRVALFVRTPSGWELTAAGERVLQSAQHMAEAAEELAAQAIAEDDRIEGLVPLKIVQQARSKRIYELDGFMAAPKLARPVPLFPLFALALFACGKAPVPPGSPHRFVSVADVDPSIHVEIRYAGAHNFMGRPIPGYRAPKCLLTEPAARALVEVQKELATQHRTLRVYDCYRPQKAVDAFVVWARDPNDVRMKSEFYPKVDKSELFAKGYIAEKSGHSRGSTLDVTIEDMDFGTPYDFFDPLAHTLSPDVSPAQHANRILFKELMEKHGFKGLREEWWHFTLVNEPYPNTYFDDNVE